jgi:dihydropteroate synthase
MAETCADSGAGVVLMHMQGSPRTMQHRPSYYDVVAEVASFLEARTAAAAAAGVDPERICIDPGIGFGKTLDHNLDLLAHLDVLVDTGLPVLVGASRKAFIGAVLESAGRTVPAPERDPGTGATVALAVAAGAAVVRVHDVAAAVQVARVADAIVRRVRGG